MFTRIFTTKKEKTRLWQLDPFVDGEGLLRVGGRLGKLTAANDIKYPVILPSKTALVDWFARTIKTFSTVEELLQSAKSGSQVFGW